MIKNMGKAYILLPRTSIDGLRMKHSLTREYVWQFKDDRKQGQGQIHLC